MNKVLEFYRTSEQRWFVDLPDYEGSIYDLEMVQGADTLCNLLNEDNENRITLFLSTKEFPYNNKLTYKNLTPEFNEGANYHLKKYNDIEFDLNVWLCDVTKFVFGEFPNEIYFCKLENKSYE